MLYTRKYLLLSQYIAVAGLLVGNITYADIPLRNDNEADSVSEIESEQSQDMVNLGTVTVLGEVTDYIGIPIGLNKGEVGRGSLNQAQLDLLQANNMASAIDKVAGVTMAGSPRPGGQTINIWGMKDSKNIPISVDGALKTFDKYQQGNLYVDPDLIKAVTVNKGAFNPDVGNGGFGGNIQLETKDATDFLKPDQKLGMFVKYGHHTNNDQNNYAAAVYGQSDDEKIDGLFYFSRALARDIRLADETHYRGSAYDQNSYLLKGNFTPIEDSKISLTLANTRYKGWMPFAAMGGNTINVEPNNEYDWKRRIFYRDQRDKTYSLNLEYAPTENPLIDFKGDIAYSETKQHDRKIKAEPGKPAPSILLSTFGEENWTTYKTANIHLRNSSRLSWGDINHTVTIGVQYLRKQQKALMFYDKNKYGNSEFNYGYFTPPFLPSGHQTITSAYINDDIEIGDFTFSPSLRFDHVKNRSFGNVEGYSSLDPSDGYDYRSVSYQGVSPRFGIYWQPNEAIALFSDYSHSWQAPTVDEMFTVQGKGVSGPNGTSRYLRKEKLKAFRFGGMLNFESVLVSDDLLNVQATVFKNKVEDEVIRKIGAIYCEAHHLTGESSSCDKPMGTFHNGPGYTIKGLEIEAKYDSEYVFGSLAASMVKGQRKGSPRDNWFDKDTWMRDIPPRELRATLGFNIPSINLSTGWQGRFVRKQDRTPVLDDPKAGALSYASTPGYSVHSVFLSYAPKGHDGPKVNLTIDNIFNKQYAPYLNDRVEAPGIDIRLSISYQF